MKVIYLGLPNSISKLSCSNAYGLHMRYWYHMGKVCVECCDWERLPWMLYLSKYRHIFKTWTVWLLQFHHRILPYFADIPKLYGRCVNPYWLLECYDVEKKIIKKSNIYFLTLSLSLIYSSTCYKLGLGLSPIVLK
jgi:hypothetical protein